jgi:sec-independent protein translocase protein TatB
MFGLGWGEMVVIGIVALIAIGPKELPTVLRSAGHWMGKIRRMANEFQGQFQEALREAELTDLKKHADDIVSDFSKFDPVADTQKEVEKAFTLDDAFQDIDRPATETASAQVTDQVTDQVPDGATLPPGTLPPIDVPMPDMPPPVTEKDFVPQEPAVSQVAAPQDAAASSDAQPAPKQAGGGA